MRLEDFRRIIEKLSCQFGEKHYTPAKMDRVWEAVRDLTPAEFESAVDTLCDSARYAPTVADIRQSCVIPLSRARQRRKQRQLSEVSGQCELCRNTGHLFAFRRSRPELEYQFRCNCHAGNVVQSNLPVWNQQHYGQRFCRLPLTASALEEYERRVSASLGIMRKGEKDPAGWRALAEGIRKARLAEGDE